MAAMALGSSVPAWATDALHCPAGLAPALQSLLDHPADDPSLASFKRRLTHELEHPTDASGHQLILTLSQEPSATLGPLYAAVPSNKWEKFSVAEHTERVLRMLEDQSRFYRTKLAPEELGLMRLAAALHDIGKSLSPQDQHAYTLPIARAFLRKLGYPPEQIRLIEALIGHDELGALARPGSTVTVAETASHLRLLAAQVPTPPEKFVRLQIWLYVSDAGSYDWIRGQAFDTLEDGRITDKSRKLDQLINAMSETSVP
jgi:hypothetical protein